MGTPPLTGIFTISNLITYNFLLLYLWAPLPLRVYLPQPQNSTFLFGKLVDCRFFDL